MALLDAISEAVSDINWVLMYLAVLSGLMFGFFYKFMNPLGSWRVHFMVGMLVLVAFFGLAGVERFFGLLRGEDELHRVLFHTFHPMIRWMVFIVAGAISVALVERFRDGRRL